MRDGYKIINHNVQIYKKNHISVELILHTNTHTHTRASVHIIHII